MTDHSLSEVQKLLNPESNKEFRATLEELDLPYQGGSRKETRDGQQFERQTFYEVEIGDQTLNIVVEEIGEYEEVSVDKIEAVPNELDRAFREGEVNTAVYVTDDRDMLDTY